MQNEKGAILLPLYLSAFTASFSLGAVVYLLPVFAQGLGASYVDLGLIGTSRSIPVAILVIFTGYLADRFNRAKIFVISLVFNALSLAALVPVAEVYDLVAIVVIQGAAFALLIPTLDVLVADTAPEDGRVRVMGRYNISMSSGFFSGPLIGGLIAQAAGFKALFLTSSALMLITAAASWAVISRRYKSHRRGVVSKSKLSSLLDIKSHLPIFLTMLPYSIILGVLFAIFPGYLANLGFTSAQVGSIVAVLFLARILTSMNIERILIIGVKKCISGAALGLSASLIFISLQREAVGFYVGIFTAGLSIGIVFPLALAVLSERLPSQGLGKVVGVLEANFGAGMIVGPMAGGFMAEVWAPNAVYAALGLLALAMIPLSMGWQRSGEKKISPELTG